MLSKILFRPLGHLNKPNHTLNMRQWNCWRARLHLIVAPLSQATNSQVCDEPRVDALRVLLVTDYCDCDSDLPLADGLAEMIPEARSAAADILSADEDEEADQCLRSADKLVNTPTKPSPQALSSSPASSTPSVKRYVPKRSHKKRKPASPADGSRAGKRTKPSGRAALLRQRNGLRGFPVGLDQGDARASEPANLFQV